MNECECRYFLYTIHEMYSFLVSDICKETYQNCSETFSAFSYYKYEEEVTLNARRCNSMHFTSLRLRFVQ